ncbi:hypothetical protein H5410_028740 [Solanum commersonii]|uniref:Uncharacterized protein n=1 Tax=Solanum commersonii TaxID=4109 RepID=A0A9J5Z5N9_SOLCO|nr:hypothetical protein H5410_028740 [Solanum commersonii]
MSFREMSMNTITEEDSDSFDSNTDAIIYSVYDDSGSDDDLLQQQQMISTAAAVEGADTDDLTVPTSASFSWYTNNEEEIEPKAIMIFNVDFRALSSVVNNEIEELNLNFCGKRVREEENEDNEVYLMNKEIRRKQMLYPLPLTTSNWSSIWDGDVNGIFDVPPLSPLPSSD